MQLGHLAVAGLGRFICDLQVHEGTALHDCLLMFTMHRPPKAWVLPCCRPGPGSQPSWFPQKQLPPLQLMNKAPHWNETLRCWCLNFRGRVKLASVKNFQLVQTQGASETVIMQVRHESCAFRCQNPGLRSTGICSRWVVHMPGTMQVNTAHAMLHYIKGSVCDKGAGQASG